MRTAADLLAAAEAAGLDVDGIELVPSADGGQTVSARMTFSDPWAAARLLTALSAQDAGDPVVRSWAQAIMGAVAEELGETGPTVSAELRDATARAIHANVQHAILFVHEPVETFQSARETMARGAGDCDDHARLVYALALSVDIPAELAFFEADEEGAPVPAHAVARLEDSDGTMQWAETTIDADYGEAPHDALARLELSGSASPLSHIDDVGGIERAAPRSVGASFGFVTPSDVQSRKDELNAVIESIDADVVNCKTLDAGTIGAWNDFLVSWRNFYAIEPGFFNAGAQARQASDYDDQIAQWQASLKGKGCGLSAPNVTPEAGGDVLSAVKIVAIAAGVIAGAVAVREIVRKVP